MSKITAVIQAGGLGTRMRELTQDLIPKPMLEMNGKPLLSWQIENLSRYGIKDFVLIVGHLGDKIKEYYRDGESLGVKIGYIEETEPLGSGGSLFYLRNYPSDIYLLIYGDVMFDVDISRWINFHKSKNSLITPACHPNSHPYDSDIVLNDSDSKITGFLWKKDKRDNWFPNMGNSGLFVFDKIVLEEISEPVKCDWEKDVIAKLVDQGKVYSYKTTEYIKDTGTPERFEKAKKEQLEGIWERRNLSKKQKCVFLDRDGTVNKYNGLINDLEQLDLECGAADAVKILNESGFLAIIVTNQPVVARGMCDEEDVRLIHWKLETLLGQEGAYLDDIIYCPHHPDKGYPEENPLYKIECSCRKPKIGMIKTMAEKYNIDLAASYMVGDTTVDIQTGINAGTKTILLHSGEGGTDGKYDVKPDYEASNLLDAVSMIMEDNSND